MGARVSGAAAAAGRGTSQGRAEPADQATGRAPLGTADWDALARVARALVYEATPDRLGEVAVAEVRRLLGAVPVALWAADGDGGALRLIGQRGLDGIEAIAGVLEPGADSPVAAAARAQTPVELSASDPGSAGTGIWAREELRGARALPLLAGERVLGVLLVGPMQSARRAFDDRERAMALALAELCAVGIDRARQTEALVATTRARDELEERYRRLVEGDPQAIAVHRGGEVLYANPAAVRMVGAADADALIGRSVLEFAHPDDQAVARARVEQAPWDARPVESPVRRFVHPDGRVVEADIVSIPALYGGAPAAYMLIRDVTDARKAKRLARETTDTLQALVRASPIAIVSLDPDGNVTTWNPAAELLFGWTAAETMGKPFPAVPDDRTAEFTAYLEHTLAVGTLSAIETRCLTRSGAPIEVSVWGAPLHGADGTVRGITGYFADISSRKRAEAGQRLLADASEVLASSLEDPTVPRRVAELAVPALGERCAVVLAEPDGRLRVAGAAGNAADAGWPLDADEGQLAEALRNRRTVLTRGSGGGSIVAAPLVAHGRSLGAIVLGRATAVAPDREELALTEELARRTAMAVDNARLYAEARAAVQSRDEFLSVAAHELRTPVAGIRAEAELVARLRARGDLGEQRTVRFVERIDAATGRLAALTEELLDVARIRSGRLPLERRRLDLVALVGGVVERYRERAGPGHRLLFEGAPTGAAVVGDAVRLEQVFENLLDNALKYSPGGGQVSATLASAAEGVLVRVIDQGIGLAPGSEESIFEPFGRAENAAQRHLPGMGLGLYISRDIVEQHGGRMWAESPGEGRGLTVNVLLPLGTVGESSGTGG